MLVCSLLYQLARYVNIINYRIVMLNEMENGTKWNIIKSKGSNRIDHWMDVLGWTERSKMGLMVRVEGWKVEGRKVDGA